MDFSKLDTRIQLQKKAEISDGQGGRKVEFTDFGRPVWAEFLAPRFRQGVVAGGAAEIIYQGVKIRCQTGVERGFRVMHGETAQIYEVNHVEVKRRDGIMILTLESVDYK